MIESIYIHIPFCNHICSYCDFSKIFYNEKLVNSYLYHLQKEMSILPKETKYKTIYIGGGTPSALNIEELKLLFTIIDEIKLDDNYEFTFECNIESITKEKLLFLKKHRVNRLSIGIESFSNKNLAFLERNYQEKDIYEKINLVKDMGFTNINVDLIYAIPNQTLADLECDIDKIISLNVNHISTYSLILEDHTKLKNQNIEYIDDELDLMMYNTIRKKLKDNGYIHYEISNFSKDGYQAIHNTNYWMNKKYYGFGLGASGYIDNYRYTNTKSINKYLIDNYQYEKEIQDKKIELENEIICKFRTNIGINKTDFINKYGFDLIDRYDIKDLIDKKIIILSNGNYVISSDYWYLLNEILLRFIEE